MCAVLLSPGVNPTTVIEYIISIKKNFLLSKNFRPALRHTQLPIQQIPPPPPPSFSVQDKNLWTSVSTHPYACMKFTEITPMYLRWDPFHFTASRYPEHGNRLRDYTNHSRPTRPFVFNITYLHSTCDNSNILIPAVRWLRYCLRVPVAHLNIDPQLADQLSSATAACHHAASLFHHANQVEDGTLFIT
jgi:hypothetical protein